MNLPTSYKVGILGLLTLAAIIYPKPAHASLHDTYEQSCARYGSKGFIYDDLIMWEWGNQLVVESFIDNECAMIRYCPNKGFDHNYTTCWDNLQANVGSNQSWQPYEDQSGLNRQSWSTTDGLIYAFWSLDGRLQIAYSWWLRKHDLFKIPSAAAHAPVEDGQVPKGKGKGSGTKL
jgi:hypothetical protein